MLVFLLALSSVYSMTLGEAVDAAVARAPSLEISSARVQEAHARVWEASAPLMPSASLLGAGIWQNEVTFTLADQIEELGLPIDTSTLPTVVIMPDFQWMGGIQGSQAIAAPGAWLMRAAAKQGERSAEADALSDRYQLTTMVLQAWHGSAKAHALRDEAANALKLAEDVLRVASASVDLGVLRADELVPVQQTVASARASVSRADAMAAAADAVLRQLTGLEGAATAPGVPTEVPDLQGLLSRIRRSDLDAANERVQAAGALAKATLAPALPVIGATGSLTYLDPAPYFGDDWNYKVQLGITVPLVQGGVVKARVDQARAREEQARAAERALTEKARTEVIMAHGNLATAMASIGEGEESIRLAEKALAIAEERLKLGAGSVLAVDQAQAKVTEPRVKLVQARSDATLAADTLELVVEGAVR